MPIESDKVESGKIDKGLESLRIDRTERATEDRPSRWSKWWIIAGIALFVGLGAWRFGFSEAGAIEVELLRVTPQVSGDSGDAVILEAAGYIVAHHKIELSPKVVGRVSWIGVEKGDPVEKNQIIVRLEDAEYRARVMQAEGSVAALTARLAELEAGSRPEEVALAQANLNEAKADLENARTNLERVQSLTDDGVFPEQQLDDAKARFDSRQARVASLDRAFELVRIGPRREVIDAVRGQVQQAEGELAFMRTRLEATLIRAPLTGTILERNVEIGEFVTTSFVGERGAKGYVVSLADLNDIQVELDISQDDFARLGADQRGTVWTDAFPDRKYQGRIVEISPEADRQKATVQVKVRILEPDDFLRPEMNANVAFLADKKSAGGGPAKPTIVIPAAALRDGNAVFVLQGGRAVRRPVSVGSSSRRGLEVTGGLVGGEDLIVNPPPELQDGDLVRGKST
jgi:HlyD family secretion protein